MLDLPAPLKNIAVPKISTDFCKAIFTVTAAMVLRTMWQAFLTGEAWTLELLPKDQQFTSMNTLAGCADSAAKGRTSANVRRKSIRMCKITSLEIQSHAGNGTET